MLLNSLKSTHGAACNEEPSGPGQGLKIPTLQTAGNREETQERGDRLPRSQGHDHQIQTGRLLEAEGQSIGGWVRGAIW